MPHRLIHSTLFVLLASVSPSFVAVAQQAVDAPVTLSDVLPNDRNVAEVLTQHPMVAAGNSYVRAAEAEARNLSAGPHEVTVSTIASMRDVRGDGQYGEIELTVMRGVRLPGRSRLDRQAGHFGTAAARNRAEDVVHQVALLLNQHWWDYLGALALARVDEGTVTNLTMARDAIARQLALREASQLELDIASAALGSAQAQLAGSRGGATEAKAVLSAQFPELAVPDALPTLPSPMLDDRLIAEMQSQVVERSHEIGAAEDERLRRDALAERARLDRFPDPNVGVRLFRDRGGEERGAGLVVSMPIGGRSRSAIADRMNAEASAALLGRMAVTRDVEQRAATDAAATRSLTAIWQGRREALEAHVAAAVRSRRGYALRATDLADMLLAERLAGDAFRAEAEARVAALRAISQLMIDSHNLWIGGD